MAEIFVTIYIVKAALFGLGKGKMLILMKKACRFPFQPPSKNICSLKEQQVKWKKLLYYKDGRK